MGRMKNTSLRWPFGCRIAGDLCSARVNSCLLVRTSPSRSWFGRSAVLKEVTDLLSNLIWELIASIAAARFTTGMRAPVASEWRINQDSRRKTCVQD
jgi:hypothetical protein